MKLSPETEAILARANPHECTRDPSHAKPTACIDARLDTLDGPRRKMYLCTKCFEIFVHLPGVCILDVEYVQ